jgi:hypothetical protein
MLGLALELKLQVEKTSISIFEGGTKREDERGRTLSALLSFSSSSCNRCPLEAAHRRSTERPRLFRRETARKGQHVHARRAGKRDAPFCPLDNSRRGEELEKVQVHRKDIIDPAIRSSNDEGEHSVKRLAIVSL